MSGPRGLSVLGTVGLPNGATTVTGTPLDLTSYAVFLGNGQISITAPALTTAELPNGQTMTYSIEGHHTARFANTNVLFTGAIVQTGAGGAGATGQTVTLTMPRSIVRWIRLTITNSGAGNPSAKSASVDIEY